MQWLEIKEIGFLLKNPVHVKEIEVNLIIKSGFNNMLKIAKFCLTLNTVDPAVKRSSRGKTKRAAGWTESYGITQNNIELVKIRIAEIY